jgi:hypothetical protein
VEWLFGELHRLVDIMGAQGMANTAGDLAKMRVSPSHPLWQDLMRRSVQLNGRDFKPQAIANLVWAFVTAGVSPAAALVEAMSSEAVSKSRDFDPQNVANLVWAFATLSVTPERWWRRCRQRPYRRAKTSILKRLPT